MADIIAERKVTSGLLLNSLSPTKKHRGGSTIVWKSELHAGITSVTNVSFSVSEHTELKV